MPKTRGILPLIKEFYPLTEPPKFTASHPVFPTWNRRPTDNLNDTLSAYDSDASDADEMPHQPTASTIHLLQHSHGVVSRVPINKNIRNHNTRLKLIV